MSVMDLNISILKDIAEALKAGGEAIKGLIETLKILVASGKQAYDHVAA
jgi:hypothetical protein